MNRNTDIISAEVVDAAYHLHKGLGPGLLESVYEQLLAKDLGRRGLTVVRQRVVPFEYDGLIFESGLKVDLLVNECLVVEIKAVEKLNPVHKRQTYTYLRLMKDGIHRIVNGYRPTPQSRLRVRS